jgi:hypothetical protein
MVVDVLTGPFAMKFMPRGRAVMAPKWEGRDVSNVRSGEHRVAKYVLERARPHLLQDFGAKLALAFGDDIDLMVAGITATRPAPLPAANTPAAVPALPPPPAAIEMPQPRTEAQMTRSHLRVVQPARNGVRFGGML